MWFRKSLRRQLHQGLKRVLAKGEDDVDIFASTTVGDFPFRKLSDSAGKINKHEYVNAKPGTVMLVKIDCDRVDRWFWQKSRKWRVMMVFRYSINGHEYGLPVDVHESVTEFPFPDEA